MTCPSYERNNQTAILTSITFGYQMVLRLLACALIIKLSTGLFVVEVPPDQSKVALMARYILNNADWVSMTTISTQKNILSYPFVTLKSVSDGKLDHGTGISYFYLTRLDVSGRDIEADNRCTIMASLAELEYCNIENVDPQDPRCPKLMLTGRIKKIDETSPEYKFGLDALFSRHPAMKSWPINNEFHVSKLNIEQIEVLDHFGNIEIVSIDDYFNCTNSISNPAKKFLKEVDINNILV